MEEENQIGWVCPLELLRTLLNIRAARGTQMGLAAWSNEHATGYDCWKHTCVDQTVQPGSNAGDGDFKGVLTSQNRWAGAVEDGAGQSHKPFAAVHGTVGARLEIDTALP